MFMFHILLAFSNPILSQILNEENLGIDVVSGGELEILIRSKFPMNEVNFMEIIKVMMN